MVYKQRALYRQLKVIALDLAQIYEEYNTERKIEKNQRNYIQPLRWIRNDTDVAN